MKIAMMTNNYKPFVAGVPISIERLTEGLRKLGHEVVVFAPTYKEQQEEIDTVRYHSLIQGICGGVSVPSPIDKRIEEEFKKREFDIIHVHHPMIIGKTAVYLSKKYNIPMTFTYHTRYEQYIHYVMPGKMLSYPKIVRTTERLIEGYLKSFFKNCHHIFAPTAGMESYLAENCGYEREKISVLPTGLADESFQPDQKAALEIRNRFGAKECPLFITVSRMAKEKNVPFLLQSVRRFKETYGKDFRFLLVGDGPDRKELEEMARKLGLSGEVFFTGKLENKLLKDYYGAADAFLFASRSETQGIVLLEAFAAKTPVIGVNATGVSDLIDDGKNGFLVPENMDIFSDRMHLLITDGLLCNNLKKGAKDSAVKFNESNIAEEALRQYNRVIEEYHSDIRKYKRGAEKWKLSIVS